MRAFAALYLALVLTPLAVVLAGPVPASVAGVWWAVAMGAGFAALSMMGAQGLLTARIRWVSALGPTDRIFRWHKYLGIAAVLMVVAHPAILVVDAPLRLVYLNPFVAPGYMTAGLAAVVAMLLLVVATVGREWLGLRHEGWRLGHDVLAATAIGLAAVHVERVRYYLADPLRHAVWVAFAAGWIGVIVYARLVRPALLTRKPWRVVGVHRERGDAWTVSLVPEGHAGVSFAPGQFAWLTLGRTPFSAGDHPFSFSSRPGLPDGRVEFTIKELGDSTRATGAVAPGTRAFVDGPYGGFTTSGVEAPGFVFIAGGIGIAPLLSMLRALVETRDTRHHLLIHAGGRWDRLTGRETVEGIQLLLDLQVVTVLQDPPPAWDGETGRVDRAMLARQLPHDVHRYSCFVCGPPGMIRDVVADLRDLGVPDGQIHAELFDLF